MDLLQLTGDTMAAGLLLYTFSIIRVGRLIAESDGEHEQDHSIIWLGVAGIGAGIGLIITSFIPSFFYIASLIRPILPF
ncbi:MAG: hypothetical protein K0Q87_1349 [Neobacillus sp.]|jgi:hypothetical protein|nr:hypothetical protein [Neobacillus sp.]